jgi:riboflavin kinase/FMN adenylyltransferase
MDIYGYIPGKKLGLGRLAVALGFFDGVHLAHRELISRTVAQAKLCGIKSAVFTFTSEGRQLKSSAARIYSTEEKLDIISSLGVDVAIVADFGAICSMSADEFISDVLVGDLCFCFACSLIVKIVDKLFGGCLFGNILNKITRWDVVPF